MKPHILIVDADSGAAQTTRALVERLAAGATLAVEPTPERGRSSLLLRLADVLIIDPAPHHLAAAQLIRWLKTERPAARIIVLASTAPAALRRTLEGMGVDLYQEKHHPPTVLIQALRGALAQITHSEEDLQA